MKFWHKLLTEFHKIETVEREKGAREQEGLFGSCVNYFIKNRADCSSFQSNSYDAGEIPPER
jgi:hypothetical protein